MAKYPRSYIYLTSLLEASEFQGATTLWTSPRLLLPIGKYPTYFQVAWQDVATQVRLGILYVGHLGSLERGGMPASAPWLELIYCMTCFHTQSAMSEYVHHNIPLIKSV